MASSNERTWRSDEEGETGRDTSLQGLTAFVVTLGDLDAGQVEAAVAAIRAVEGVVSVRPVDADPGARLVRERADAEWRERILGLLDDEGV